MKKTISGGNRTAVITLDGTECEVKFDSTYTVFSVKSDSEVTVSLESGKSAGDDGVMICPAGESIMYPHMQRRDKLYITGSGTVQVFASNEAVNPFKMSPKGGETKPKILPHSEGLTAYFDCEKNVSGTRWADIVSGLTLNAPTIINDDLSVSFSEAAVVNTELLNTFTVYILFKYIGTETGWANVCTANSDVPRFGLSSANKRISIDSGSSSTDIVSEIPSTDYHVCCMAFARGMGALHIDGVTWDRHNNYSSHIRSLYSLYPDCAFKMAAFFKDVSHSPDHITANSTYILQKYGISEV